MQLITRLLIGISLVGLSFIFVGCVEDGEDGVAGLTTLVKTTAEPAGSNCTESGIKVEVGIDNDGSGTLDPGEIDNAQYVCDGADGTDGEDGLNSLINPTPLEPSDDENCNGGGVRIDIGLDDNRNGTLDPDEIDQTVYVCMPIRLPANITISNPLLQKVIPSTFDDTPYTPAIDIQGVIDAGGLTVPVPYTVINTATTLPAYSTSVTLDASVTEDDESGIVATFAWAEQADLPVGSGFFTATIAINDSAGNADDIYNAKQLDIQDDSAGLVATTFPYATDSIGSIGTLTLKIMPGIPDRMFGKPDNTGNNRTHEFLYVPVINSTTGETWLSNNLGAHYSDTNSPEFNITKQATATNDHHAYGSLFQWGRKADGHELITWINGSTGIGTNGTTTTKSDDPADALFIMRSTDWRENQNDDLWASESSENNVCPVGYRVPTNVELDAERQSWVTDGRTNNAAGAMGGDLKLPVPGYRDGSNGTVLNEGTYGIYWVSTVYDAYAQNLHVYGSGAGMDRGYRAHGFTVRCLKD